MELDIKRELDIKSLRERVNEVAEFNATEDSISSLKANIKTRPGYTNEQFSKEIAKREDFVRKSSELLEKIESNPGYTPSSEDSLFLSKINKTADNILNKNFSPSED